MRPGGLRRAVAARIARWVQAWAGHVVQEEPQPLPPPERDALEDWVARVQAAAPELLIGLDLPPVGAGAPEPFAGGAPPGRGAPRGAGRAPTPAPRLPVPSRRAPGSEAATAQPESPFDGAPESGPATIQPQSAFGTEPPFAGYADPPAEPHGKEREAGGGARAEPPRVLRFTERTRRTASPPDHRPSEPAPERPSGEAVSGVTRSLDGGRPSPPSPDVARALPAPGPALTGNAGGDATRPGDALRRSQAAPGSHADGAGPPKWNRAPPGDAPASEPPRARAVSRPPRPEIAPPPDLAPWRGADLPDPWPELPPEPPPTELEDAFLRRMERLHRLAREQRGD